MHIDAVDLEVIKASLAGIVQEMQNSLFRTGFSTIVRESQDASCALMNAQGEVVAQHVVLPLHIGAFPACCGAVLSAYGDTIAEGDAFLINHPYQGGSPHAPDMCVIVPVFVDGALFGFGASIAHKGDIGGPVPGSCSGQAREIFNEGLHLPAMRYQRKFEHNTDLDRVIAANSRTPELVIGDIRGQLGSGRLGERRLHELVAKYGKDKVLASYARLFEIGEARVRAAIAEWADGRYEAERFVDDDGITLEKPVRIHVVAEKKGDRLHFDFSGSADQTQGPANIRPPLAQAACAYVLISLIDPHMYVSSGLLRAFSITARDGSVLNPRFPAPVNTYNPTIHALVDALFAALAPIVPEKVRADGAGSRSIIIGGRSTSAGKSYVQYEIFGGGAGARATKDGAVGHQCQPEQRQDGAGRDHRKRISDAAHPLRAHSRFRRRRTIPRRPRHPPRIRQSRRGAIFDPLDQTHHPAERHGRRQRGTPGRYVDQSRNRRREAAADALRRLSAARGRRVPPRYTRRRRLRRSAIAAGRARARRRARRPSVGGRCGTRLRCSADGRWKRCR